MFSYLVVKRHYGNKNISPIDNTNEVVGVFQSPLSARICMENIVFDAITKRNGEDALSARICMENIIFNAIAKRDNEEVRTVHANYKYPFLFDLTREHKTGSTLWSNIQLGHYFATRDANEIDKIIIHEKYKTDGFFYNSWDTKKIFSVEICKLKHPLDDEVNDKESAKELAQMSKLKIDDLLDCLRDDLFDSVIAEFKHLKQVPNQE